MKDLERVALPIMAVLVNCLVVSAGIWVALSFSKAGNRQDSVYAIQPPVAPGMILVAAGDGYRWDWPPGLREAMREVTVRCASGRVVEMVFAGTPIPKASKPQVDKACQGGD